MKSIKFICLILCAVMLMGTVPCTFGKAGEDNSSIGRNMAKEDSNIQAVNVGGYTIDECLIQQVSVHIEDESISLWLDFGKETLTASGKLFCLEGAAFYADKYLMQVDTANYQVLYCEIAKQKEANNFEIECVVIFPKVKKITVLKGNCINEAKEIDKLVSYIDMDNEIYEQLVLASRWETIYIENNAKNIGSMRVEEYQEEIDTLSTASTDVAIDIMQHYGIPEQAFFEPYFVMGYMRDISGEIKGFYVRDTYETYSGRYVSLIALYDIHTVITKNGNNIGLTFKVERVYNYFVDAQSSGTISVTEASNNSTYILTRNPSIGLRLIGNYTQGQINNTQFSINQGGSYSTSSTFLTNTSLSIIGKMCTELATPLAAVSFFGDGLEALTNYNFESASNKFLFSNLTNYRTKAVASSNLSAQLYKKYSMLGVFASMGNVYTNSSSGVLFEYYTGILGSVYMGDTNGNYAAYAHFTRQIN